MSDSTVTDETMLQTRISGESEYEATLIADDCEGQDIDFDYISRLESKVLSSIVELQDLGSRYQIGDEIGRGTFATVTKVIDRKSKLIFAAKTIDTERAGNRAMNLVKQEVTILSHLRHPGVLSLDNIFTSNSCFHIITEYLPGGPLLEKVTGFQNYSEFVAATLIRNLTYAVKYFHSRGVVHRDLKPENIVLKVSSGEEVQLLGSATIIDFGIAGWSRGSKRPFLGMAGTPRYMAPEVVSSRPYGKEVDMWGLGLLLYILIAGKMPFNGRNSSELFKEIREKELIFEPTFLWSRVSDNCRNFVKQLFQKDPDDRMTADAAVQHEWLSPDFMAELKSSQSLNESKIHVRKFRVREKFKTAILSVAATRRLANICKRIRGESLEKLEEPIKRSKT